MKRFIPLLFITLACAPKVYVVKDCENQAIPAPSLTPINKIEDFGGHQKDSIESLDARIEKEVKKADDDYINKEFTQFQKASLDNSANPFKKAAEAAAADIAKKALLKEKKIPSELRSYQPELQNEAIDVFYSLMNCEYTAVKYHDKDGEKICRQMWEDMINTWVKPNSTNKGFAQFKKVMKEAEKETDKEFNCGH